MPNTAKWGVPKPAGRVKQVGADWTDVHESTNTRQGCPLTCGVCVTKRGVQKDVSETTSPDVHGFVGDVSEDDAAGIHAPHGSFLPDLGLTIWRESQQP